MGLVDGLGRVTSPAVPGAAGADTVAARASAEPEGAALAVDGGDDLTFGAWERRSNAVARGLAARGFRPGDRVGLLFDGRRWADYCVAHLGVLKAGAVAVLLSPGATPPGVARVLSGSGATGLLCASHLAPSGASVWAADPEEIGRGHGSNPMSLPVRPRTIGDLAAEAGPAVDGCLVHAWAPGSHGGRYAMGLVVAGGRVTALATFDADRFCALVAAGRAVACGLTPGLAAAVLASGAPGRHDLSTLTRVVLSGPPSSSLRAGLRAAFPRAAVSELVVEGQADRVTGGAVPAPVAISQEGMLWHEQFTPGSFNLPCLVRRYEGPLDLAVFEGALSELVRRHEPLRTTFTIVDGHPRQVVGEHRPPALAVTDLAALTPPERDTEVARLLADATARPFDLATGPLFEPRVVRLGPDDHLLVVRLHHTVFDDWSVDVFRRELSALYAAGLSGAPSPLVEPRTSFTAFSGRQRERMAGGDGDAQRAWWRRELDGAPLAVQLTIGEADGGGAATPEPGEPLRLDLPPRLATELRALAPRLRATPFMTVLSAFSVLLARETGQEDLLIATVVAHRQQSDLEPLVGCFTKKVPLRLRVEGDPTFPELVARTRASLLGSLSHQDVAFDAALQEALGRPAADHGVVPQVAVVFQGETPQQVRLSLPGLVTGPYDVRAESRRERHYSSRPHEGGDRRSPRWGDGIYLGTFLILSLREGPEGMALVARGVFSRPAAQRLLERFAALLADVVADPHRPISALPAGNPAGNPAGATLELRGFRAERSRIEAALARCPGVADVALAVRDGACAGEGPRLVAYVVADRDPPTLTRLRHALWAALPGALWPAEAVVVDRLVRLPDGRLDPAGLPRHPTGRDEPVRPDPLAVVLAAMWNEAGGGRAGPDMSYWQDFSFLSALAEARQAGIDIPDETVVRCRTPEMLAAALAVAAPSEV